MKKITTNYIKKILGGGSAKQLFAINSLLDLQLQNLEKNIKEETTFLNEKEASEIEKIKSKYAEKKLEIEDSIISKAIREIATKNKIVVEKKSLDSETILENKIEEVQEKVEEETLSEADKIMEELVFNSENNFSNSWNNN